MHKAILLVAWMHFYCVVSAHISPVLQVSNSAPIMNCTVVHCKVSINNETPLSERYAVSIDDTNLKIAKSNLPKQFDIESGASLSYDFDFMVSSESPSSMELKLIFESLTTKSVSIAQKTIKPVSLPSLSSLSSNITSQSCNQPILFLLDKDTEISNDLTLYHNAGITIMAKPEAQLLVAAQLSLQNVSFVACETAWDDLKIADGANVETRNTHGIKQKAMGAEMLKIQVFPNPTQELLNVTSSIKGAMKTNILDANGRVVLTKTSAFPMQYDVSSLPAAAYLLQVETAKGNLYQTFTKMN